MLENIPSQSTMIRITWTIFICGLERVMFGHR